MNLIDTRTIFGIGSGVCNIYTNGAVAEDGKYEDGVGYVVEVLCNAGRAAVEVELHDEAFKTWLHPFALGLDSPVAQADKPWTATERDLYVALEVAEAGVEDEA